MNAFEHFLNGEDALARLIRSQPDFVPTAEQEARLLAAMTRFQPQTTASTPFDFEPPATMEARFLQQAGAIAQTQAPRRDALLGRLQNGESTEAVLGHRVSPATQDWLASQQPAASPKAKPRTTMRWWQWSSTVLASALVAAIGFQLIFPAKRQQQAEIAATPITPAPQAAVALQLAESLPLAAPEPARKAASSTEKPRTQIAAMPPTRETTTEHMVADIEQAKAVETESTARTRLATASLQDKHQATESAPPVALAMAPQPIPVIAPEPARRLAAVPAPQSAAAPPAIARKAAAPASQIRIILLSEDPADIARTLSSDWTGHELILQAADPQSAAVQDWASRLRVALPPETRLSVQPATDLGTDRVRLIRP